MNQHERRQRAKLSRADLPKVESQVVVHLMYDEKLPEGRQRFIRVELYSHRIVAAGRLKSQSDIFPWECNSEAEFERKIEAVAGAMAENQCEVYLDNHDPSEVARAAKELYRELRLDQKVYTPPPKQE